MGRVAADFVPAPDVILITHPHADHFSAALIAAVATRCVLHTTGRAASSPLFLIRVSQGLTLPPRRLPGVLGPGPGGSTTLVIGPEDVTTPLESTAGFLGTTRTILPFNATNVGDIRIAAIPAYNLDPNSLYHRRGAPEAARARLRTQSPVVVREADALYRRTPARHRGALTQMPTGTATSLMWTAKSSTSLATLKTRPRCAASRASRWPSCV